MQINDGWEIRDEVSGLSLKVVSGKFQNHLHIEHIGTPICPNRDLFFNLDGRFDGTGSYIGKQPKPLAEPARTEPHEAA